MRRLREFFEDSKICNVRKKGKCLIANVNNEILVLKEKNNHNIKETYDYLTSRNFDYYPKLKTSNDKYNVFEYVDDINAPMEQKAFDMMTLLSLLHNKTTFYKEMDMNEYKEVYEELLNKIEYTTNYYNNLITSIESHVFMSPSEYLVARNISKILGALSYSKANLDDWYEIIKNTPKKRVVLLYNNIDINHVIKNKDLYLINWEKSKLGIPIYDLYNFYIKYSLYFDFVDLFDYYEKKYPLLKEEKLLLNILISIPDIIYFTDHEVNNCKSIKNIIDIIYKSEILLSKNIKKGNTE